jgi:hypothetical protein
MSDTTRERLVQWCGTTLLSRLDDKARDAIILVMQRLHVGDLSGHFPAQGGWQTLNLPAIDGTRGRSAVSSIRPVSREKFSMQ